MQEKYQTTKKKEDGKKSEVYVNAESESSGAIICGADLGSAGPSVRGPGRREDRGRGEEEGPLAGSLRLSLC